MNSIPEINLEFLPDWARTPSSRSGSHEKTFSSSESQHRDQRQHKTRPEKRKSFSHKQPLPKPSYNQRHEPELSVEVRFIPEQKNLESVVQQIQSTARAYPLFSLAKMFLEKPERQLVRLRFRSKKDNRDKAAYQCTICGEIFFEQKPGISHCLADHRNIFYESQRQQGEALKGNFSSIACCQLDGTVLGPTNHHTYQPNVLRLYQTKFSHMAFDRFKQSIQTVRDPEMIKKWLEETTWKTTYKCLQSTEEKILHSETELERHFSENHAQTVLRQNVELVVDGKVSRQLKDPQCLSAIRYAWEEESRYPIHTALRLREELFRAGLQVFKGKKALQYASFVRPKNLVADTTIVSPGILAILDFIGKNQGADRKKLLESLAPQDQSTGQTEENKNLVDSPSSKIIQDLHWLIYQGHVIEYWNGSLEIAPSKNVGGPAGAAKGKQETNLKASSSTIKDKKETSTALESQPSKLDPPQ